MDDLILIKENQVKYCLYLSCNVNKHCKSQKPGCIVKKNLTRLVEWKQTSYFGLRKYNKYSKLMTIVLWIIAYMIFCKHYQDTKHCCNICRFFKVVRHYSNFYLARAIIYVSVYQSVRLCVYLFLFRYIYIQNWAKKFGFGIESLWKQKDLNYGCCY